MVVIGVLEVCRKCYEQLEVCYKCFISGYSCFCGNNWNKANFQTNGPPDNKADPDIYIIYSMMSWVWL